MGEILAPGALLTEALWQQGVPRAVRCGSLGADGEYYGNVKADEMAASCAAAVVTVNLSQYALE